MSKNTAVVYAPVDTYAGYGARSRDFVKALIKVKPDWDIKIISCRWGNTRMGFLEDHEEWDLMSRIIPGVNHQPDYFIFITIPNEFQKIGKYNIGVTAGIETTLCHPDWVEGCNKIDLVLVSSEHGKAVFENSKFDIQDNQTGQIVKQVSLTTPVEVLFEGVDLSKYFPKDLPGKQLNKGSITQELDQIPEEYCFLSVGHWLQGEFGHDRKNLGFTVKTFLETFKDRKEAPALILKTQYATSCIMDREQILDKIGKIRKQIKADSLPNIYLLHGDISDEEMNELYNHPKVKTMVSHTRGEGFGRPLLEFAVVGKPIIVSGWSGQVDFLNKDYIVFIGGILEQLHYSSVVDKVLIAESKWFKPDELQTVSAYKELYKNYSKYTGNAKKQGQISRREWDFASMEKKLSKILREKVPELPKPVQISLPKLNIPKITKSENNG